MQDAYQEYCTLLRNRFSDTFWRVFSAVYQERVVTIDAVLKTTRDVFIRDVDLKKKIPTSVRELRNTTRAVAGDFASHVMHQISVDLRQFALPGNPQNLKFCFVNPLWAWVQAANDMLTAGCTMHFVPKTMVHEQTGERIYGAGVQFGDALKLACMHTPVDTKPALFGISFDGGDSGVSTRSVYPICVSVLNFNGANPLQCGLVGFLPAIQVPKSFKETEDYRAARAHVLQVCIGAILTEIENVARDGFTARLGKRVSRFRPFMVAVRVDSKERKTYFGMKSDRLAHI